MEKINRRGWVVILKDGTEYSEWEHDWKDVPKSEIDTLALVFEGRVWKISGQTGYFQRKRGSISPGEVEPIVEQRIIGYYEDEFKVEYVVDERTGIMNMRVVEGT